jgi:hypothetical protein
MKKEIRKALVETKEKKERLLIEQSLVKSRIMMIVESENNIKNFNSLPKRKQRKIADGIIREMLIMDRQGLLSEGLLDALSTIFGSSWSGLLQAIGEPIVNRILTELGFGDGYIKNFLISFFTKNWGRLANALRGDCKELTGLVAESLVEAVEMQLGQSRGLTGAGYSFIRNALNAAISNQSFLKNMEEQLESTICGLYHKFTDKATDVASKLKTSKDTATSAVPAG